MTASSPSDSSPDREQPPEPASETGRGKLATTLPDFTPVPRKKQRHNGWTPQRQRLFIETLADTGSVKSSARAVGLTPESAYYLRRQPGAEEFRKAWEAALDIGMQRVEDVAMDRALNGVEEPVFAYGEFVGTRRVYNDQLLMFMLRARSPARFATGGGPRALNGADKFQLKTLKKQWRAEWEAERIAALPRKRADTLERLNAKIDRMRERKLATMSPRTRAAYDAYMALEAQDEAEGYEWWTDPDHPMNAGDMPEPQDADAEEAEWQARALPTPEQAALLTDRSRRVKDDGWEIIRYEEEYDDGAA
ncbi:hypothetical protein [Aurantiacibacter poecillastricola]|uniref:hypothetical protein n=1 Tax=Aurantiacibacter poecillastricola TaxID=3064385 RepID=UPI00273FDC3A|nr:hypothetical protein [Aurantiacibacter sp. 219JJ12-13]MDP5261804.1 hypothetical protein [Aurantiacibacter sp. 219JJ12-13]